MEGSATTSDGPPGWVEAHWVWIVALGVVLHGSASLGRGLDHWAGHHVSPWLVVAVLLSVAGGWWVALKPERLQAKSPAYAWAFGVAVVLCLAFDAGAKASTGVFVRNGATALAWILGVGLSLGRHAILRRRLGLAPVATAPSAATP